MKLRHWPLYALGGIFITPFIVAALVLFSAPKIDFKTTQHGNFINPIPVHLNRLTDLNGTNLPDMNLKNKWRVIYNQAAECNQDCLAEKARLLNVHKALGKDRNRVVFATGDITELATAAPAKLYIIDPIDHCIMYYTAENQAQDLLKDLKRLLKYSHAN